MVTDKLKKNKDIYTGGFVILFSVMLSGILLAIAIGVADIALTELKFSASAKDSNNAFYAADTGVEYLLFSDKPPTPFVPPAGDEQIWSYIILGLGSNRQSCAKISIKKDNTAPPITTTTIISKGYNIGDSVCESTSSNLIERELLVTY